MRGETCFLCRKPALMGFHPACVQRAALLTPLAEASGRPCATCPFRRDRPTWMDRGRLVLNQLRVKRGRGQDCHKTFGDYKPCAGIFRCASGGDHLTFSPEELRALKPVESDEEAANNYLHYPANG